MKLALVLMTISAPTLLVGCPLALAQDQPSESTPRQFQNIHAQGGLRRSTDLKFAHLTTNDGLSQSDVTAILQDRQGFMWFATRDGLNRYDGNAFVVYKHNPNDPGSLSANRLRI